MNEVIRLQNGEDYITLTQLLKLSGTIGTGGQAKFFLSEYNVYVNGERETRRGKKIYRGDEVEVEGTGVFKVE